MPRCQHCDKYCSSESGLSNHLNACKVKKRKRESALDEKECKIQRQLEQMIKLSSDRPTPMPSYVFNNCTFNIQYVQNFNAQCDSFASKVGGFLNDPRAVRMLNSGHIPTMDLCIENVRTFLRQHGSKDEKHILDQLEAGEVHIDEEQNSDTVDKEFNQALNRVDARIEEVVLSKIVDPELKKRCKEAVAKQSLFYKG